MAIKKEWKESKIILSHAIIGGAVALVIGVFIGLGWNNFAPLLGFNGAATHSWSELDEVYNALSKNYDGELDYSVLLDGAKHGMVQAVGDTYTEYFSAKESEEFADDLHGNVGAGIGIEFGLRGGYLRVLRTLPDNPARAAGILAGDIIYKVDGEDVHAESSTKVSTRLHGEPGSEVTVTVYRDGEYLDFTMARAVINNVSAELEYDGDTAIMSIHRFDSDTGQIASQFAKEIIEKGSTKLILDLRSNGGGYVSAARELLSLWLNGDKILIQKSAKKSTDDITYAYSNRAILADLRTIVLVNGSTASASEIVAGALQDYKKATILGETTYGKGVVQTLLNLSGGTQLKVTTARWYTPDNNSINKIGITPDVEVQLTFDDTNNMRDPQLRAAKELE